MTFLKEYNDFIEKEINAIDLPENPANLYNPLRYFLKLGGKRIRPALTLMAGKMFGVSVEKTKNAALAVEVFHNFTLIHDDIMDNAPLRRNQKTIHEEWNSNIAILAGDVLFVKSYELLGKNPDKYLNDLFTIFSKTAREVCEGQQMDMDFETRESVHEADYIEMIRLKTSVLLGCALELGAILGGANEEDRKNIYDFGIHLGIAFQIQDDILDLFGSPEKVGKQPGGDVICNKKTLLSITATNLAKTSEDLEKIQQLGKETDLELKVNDTRNLYLQLGVRKSCEDKKEFHYHQAIAALNKIPEEFGKDELMNLAHNLFDREY
jgi:geranylgeranyl diphosphate synthase type II